MFAAILALSLTSQLLAPVDATATTTTTTTTTTTSQSYATDIPAIPVAPLPVAPTVIGYYGFVGAPAVGFYPGMGVTTFGWRGGMSAHGHYGMHIRGRW